MKPAHHFTAFILLAIVASSENLALLSVAAVVAVVYVAAVIIHASKGDRRL